MSRDLDLFIQEVIIPALVDRWLAEHGATSAQPRPLNADVESPR